MRKTGGTVLLTLVLLAAAFAGCIGTDTITGLETSDEGTDEGTDGASQNPGYNPNTFLLDSPRPYNTRVSGGAEPMVMVDQAGEYVLIGDTAGVHRSTDDGETWSSTSPFPILADGISLAQDDTGTVYATTTSIPSVMTSASADGESFGPLVPVADASPIADRPWIDARGDGELVVLFYDFGRTLQEYCLFTNDGHEAFEDRQALPLQTIPNAGNVVFDDDGNIHWAIGNELWSRERINLAGQASAVCQSSPVVRELTSSAGPHIFTQVATDGERVYLATPSSDSGTLLIGAAHGVTRSAEVALQPTDGTADLVTNTFLALSVTEDEVAVSWYGSETPGDPSDPDFDGSWNVFTAQITNFWDHDEATLTCEHADVTCTRLTDEPNHVGDLCMGGTGCGGDADRDLLDYFGIDHGPDGTLYIAYGHDGDTTNAETRFACIGSSCAS